MPDQPETAVTLKTTPRAPLRGCRRHRMRTSLSVFYVVHRTPLLERASVFKVAGRKAAVRGTEHTVSDRPTPRTQLDGGVGRRRDSQLSCCSDAQSDWYSCA